ncbi:MAG: hypothetical protein FK731_05955 [Asgard group archaeon]|nr:hypothetical protein [Asgard group archaeon]
MPFVTNSKMHDTNENYNCKANEYHVNSFTDFELYTDNDLVDSYNYGDYIEFKYIMENTEVNQSEQYLLTLDNERGCSDFTLKTRFSYYAANYVDRLTFRIFVGSYYLENDNYVSVNPLGSGSQKSIIVGGGIWDAWVASTGKHVAIAFPDNIQDRQETEYNSLDGIGEIEVTLQRYGSNVIAKINDTKDDSLQIDYSWFNGLDRQVNYILLEFYSVGLASNVSLEVMSIDGTFLIGEIITLIFPGFSIQTSIISLISILGLTWIYFSRNKNKKIEVKI